MKSFICALFAVVVMLAWHGLLDSVPLEYNLAGNWKYALGESLPTSDSSAWRPIQLPQDLPLESVSRFDHWIYYKTEFKTPPGCLNRPCALLFGEVGDAVEVSVNGQQLTQRGAFPPAARYEKNFPIDCELPATALNQDAPNEVILKVYAFKYHQAGPRKGPIGIADASQARNYVRTKTFCTVFLPLGCSMGLVLLAFVTYVWLRQQKREAGDCSREFQVYCLTTAVFMASFSETPRQFFPVGIAIPFHFLARYASDWTLYRLVTAYFGLRSKPWRWVDRAYAAALVPYVAVFLLSCVFSQAYPQHVATGIDFIYSLVGKSVLLMLTGPLVGFFACLRGPRSPDRNFAAVGFAAIAVFFTHDYLVCHTVLQGEYISKFQQFLTGTAFIVAMIRRHVHRQIQERTASRAAAELGTLAARVAHDVRSPLAALQVVVEHANDMPEEQRTLVRHAVDRINQICATLLKKHRQPQMTCPTATVDVQICEVLNVADMVVAETRSRWLSHADVSIRVVSHSQGYGIFAKVDPGACAAVLSNLLNNAVEAVQDVGAVTLCVRQSGSLVHVEIRDSGCGMPEEVVARLGEQGYTRGKAHGNGLGVFQAISFARANGGDLRIQSTPGQGTTVTLLLPVAAPPPWFVPTLELPQRGVVAVLDDDKSIHEVWRQRLKAHRCEVLHMASPHELRSHEHADGIGRYLVDYEMHGANETGLELIESLGIAQRSILVTSHAGDEAIQRRCNELGIGLISKSMVGHITIREKVAG